MKELLYALKAKYPNAAIITEAQVLEGRVILTAGIENDGHILAQGTRVYDAIPADGLSGNAAVLDALWMVGLQNVDMQKNSDGSEAEDQGSVLLSEKEGTCEAEQTKSETPAEHFEETPGHLSPNEGQDIHASQKENDKKHLQHRLRTRGVGRNKAAIYPLRMKSRLLRRSCLNLRRLWSRGMTSPLRS